MAEFPSEIMIVIDLDGHRDRVAPLDVRTVLREDGPSAACLAVAAISAAAAGAYLLPILAVAAVEAVTSVLLWRSVARGGLVMVEGDALRVAASMICRSPGARDHASTPVKIVAGHGRGWWAADPASAASVLAASWAFSWASGGSWLGCIAAAACAIGLWGLVCTTAKAFATDEVETTVDGLSVLLEDGIGGSGARLGDDRSGLEADTSRADPALLDATEDSTDGDNHARNA